MNDPAFELNVLSEMLIRAEILSPSEGATAVLAQAAEEGVRLIDSVADGAEELPAVLSRRASYDLLRHRALVLGRRERELSETIVQLATESLELHDRLWELQERSQRLKIELGRREVLTLRPPETPRIGSGRSRQREERLDRRLADLESRKVALPLSDEMRSRAERIIAARGWERDWGEDSLLLVIAYGLAALERQHSPTGGADLPSPSTVENELAALRYRVFQLGDSLKVLGIRETAFSIDNQGMRMRTAQLEQEVAALDEELARRPPGQGRPRRRGGLWRLLGLSGPKEATPE